MQIKSQFKDYYDYVANVYGGGDPSVKYIRHRLVPMKMVYGEPFGDTLVIDYKMKEGFPKVVHTRTGCVSIKWISICGIAYACEHIGDTLNDYKLIDVNSEFYSWSLKNGSYKESVDFLNISRIIKAPVFMLDNPFTCGSGNIGIDGEIPILGKIGFAGIIPAEQMYQNIAYFIANTMNDSPDMMPPVKMSDKEKIISHGFDTKISFRHRI